MKKRIAFILILVCVLGLAACNNYEGPLSCVSHIGDNGTIALMDMTEAAQNEILSALNSGEWVNDVANCAHDYEFTIENETIRYHSECGTFIDIANGRSMTLSETGKNDINKILGIVD